MFSENAIYSISHHKCCKDFSIDTISKENVLNHTDCVFVNHQLDIRK